ncbi:MAG: hypothetical protein IT562_12825 [Alphaproteobacteria bacterium]|nr:hypothetical protein [Alphaproteobacteria bacterium]
MPAVAGLLAAMTLLASVPAARAIDATNNPRGNQGPRGDTGNNGGAQQSDDAFRRTEYKVDTRLGPELSISSQVRVRPPSVDGGSDASGIAPGLAGATDDRGLYVEQMYGTYERPFGGVRVGKYENPAFGVPNDAPRGPGVLGWESPLDEYRLNRALGVNPFAKLDAGVAGNVRVDASVFGAPDAATAPIGAAGPESSPSRGGTQSPSVALSLDASDVMRVKGLGYHLGMQRLAADPADPAAARQGVATGLRYGTALGGGSQLGVSAEAGYVQQADPAGAEVVRPGMALKGSLDDWRAFANYSATREAAPAPPAEPATGERSYGAGLGYVFGQGPSVDLAWMRRKAERESLTEEAARDSVGLRMKYNLKF